MTRTKSHVAWSLEARREPLRFVKMSSSRDENTPQIALRLQRACMGWKCTCPFWQDDDQRKSGSQSGIGVNPYGVSSKSYDTILLKAEACKSPPYWKPLQFWKHLRSPVRACDPSSHTARDSFCQSCKTVWCPSSASTCVHTCHMHDKMGYGSTPHQISINKQVASFAKDRVSVATHVMVNLFGIAEDLTAHSHNMLLSRDWKWNPCGRLRPFSRILCVLTQQVNVFLLPLCNFKSCMRGNSKKFNITLTPTHA